MVHADGQGRPGRQAGHLAGPLHDGAQDELRWGWKNFYDEDSPMLTPEQTVAIAPQPVFVSYQ